MLNLFRKAEDAAAGWPGLLARAHYAAGMPSGEHRQKKPGMGERFWQFREYAPSDRPQDIDWRQSAKGDKVFIREKERQVPRNFTFWCDGNPGMDFRSDTALESKRAAAQILCLAMALLATRAHETIWLAGSDFRAGRTDNTLQRMARHMTGASQPALQMLAREKIPAGGMLVLAGDFLESAEDIETALNALHRQSPQGLLLQVLDPAELTLPYEGRVRFEGPGVARHETIDHVESVRAEYKSRMQAHIAILRDLCRAKDWHHILHVTDTDPRRTMHAVWLALQPDRPAGGLRS